MRSAPFVKAVALLALLVPQAGAVQRPAPAPAPVPAPAPAQPPAKDPAKREARAKQAEAERKAQEQREQAERERVKRAREQAKAGETAPPGAGEPSNEMREAARNLFALERAHRERLARIERLLDLYREKGDQAKLLELEQMRAKENKRYGRFVEKYKQEMGPAFEQVQDSLLAGSQRNAPKQRGKVDEKPAAPPRAREAKPDEQLPAPPRAREAKPDEKQGGGQ